MRVKLTILSLYKRLPAQQLFVRQPACCSNMEFATQAAETKALALGAVNSNLLELKRRVNSTLTDMLTVTATLETARQRLDRKRAEAVRGCSA